MLKIGIDFDNTIVCYDQIFHKVALEKKLIPADLPPSKNRIRDYLRRAGREDDWTEMQGYVYGERMAEALPFPGALEAIAQWIRQGIDVYIISHKTRSPYKGRHYDLHQAAMRWLESQGVFDPHRIGIDPQQVCFDLSKQEKLSRIAAVACTHFIDDLPEFLTEPSFPAGIIRILFDPQNHYGATPLVQRLSAWHEIRDFVVAEDFRMAHSSKVQQAASNLLAQAIQTRNAPIYPVPGGGNNRVYKIEAHDKAYLLKEYFQHADDPRDRVGAEYSFSQFAWANGLRCLPQPLACDAESHLALYEFVHGRRLSPGEVNAVSVQAALDFVLSLNAHRDQPRAAALPDASEACFSIAAHLARVAFRIQRLDTVAAESPVHRLAHAFIGEELSPTWTRVAQAIHAQARHMGLQVETDIDRRDRCLSPSDFGFHNALIDANGVIRFIDFEYAGWDDPAKMVCDFFSQPAVPVPRAFLTLFVDHVVDIAADPEACRQRIALLMPIYRMKWCCIMLNDFLPIGDARRRFSRSPVPDDERKKAQLDKARQALLHLQRDLIEA